MALIIQFIALAHLVSWRGRLNMNSPCGGGMISTHLVQYMELNILQHTILIPASCRFTKRKRRRKKYVSQPTHSPPRIYPLDQHPPRRQNLHHNAHALAHPQIIHRRQLLRPHPQHPVDYSRLHHAIPASWRLLPRIPIRDRRHQTHPPLCPPRGECHRIPGHATRRRHGQLAGREYGVIAGGARGGGTGGGEGA